MKQNLYSFEIKDAKGQVVQLNSFSGKAVLIVNVASKCGYTPQYTGLEALYQKYKDQGFVILGFPCNQFGGQEPGTDQEVQQFCSLTYNVQFPVMGKINVNGDESAPLYTWLKSSAPGILGTEAIKWNFTKFLIDKSGNVFKRYAPQTEPSELSQDIETLLKN